MTSSDANAAVSAALRGATLAFNGHKNDTDKASAKPTPGPKAPRLQHRDSGALKAATQASREYSANSRPRSPTSPPRKPDHNAQSRGVSRQTTGGSVQDHGQGAQGRELEHGAVTRKLSQYLGSSPASPYLLSPGAAVGKNGRDNRSASFIAATLAASRSVSPSPHHTGQGGYFPHTPQPAHSPLNPTVVQRRSPEARSANSSPVDAEILDTSSIPPTNALISMFEKQKDDAAPVKDPLKKFDTSPMQPKLGNRPKLRARTPPRLPSPQAKPQPRENKEVTGRDDPITSSALGTTARSSQKAKQPVPRRPTTPPQVIRRAATTEILSPKPRRLGPKPSLQQLPPAVRPRATVDSLSTVTKPSVKPSAQESRRSPLPPFTSDEHPVPSAPETKLPEPAAPALIRRTSASSASSDDTFVSASSTRSPGPSSPVGRREGPAASVENLSRVPASKRAPSPPKPNLRRTSSMVHVNPSKPTRLHPITRTSTTVDSNHPNSSSSTLPLDSLTSAIMAGNLAANRLPSSPALPPPIPAPRRHGLKHLHPHHHTASLKHHHSGGGNSNSKSNSQSRSPPRQAGTLLTTLRHPPSHSPSDEEDTSKHHRRRKPLQSKKKHAHHEGARKRWREEVSARERKRYEAVWASNRGLFSDRLAPETVHKNDTQDASDLVLNVVVRDIWSRSRLPFDELAEVWDLVYHDRKGGLNREEFVVGMWLIDQRLRGRKIPARVSDSVWESARGMRVKMPKGKK